MRKILLSLFVLLLLSTIGVAQKAVIKGMISDTSNQATLSNAVISLLRAKDSVLYKFTRSNPQGKFSIGPVEPGKFILLVTYPKYADYVDALTIADSVSLELGRINLTLKAKLLEEVVVKQKIAAIKMKGDTTEFTADSFRVQPNATVEDLLKQLPGMQVDKNGKITAQGETVQKVLVDGEEFFGDDPTLVTQNLRADMVDKIQVFDKKSDQAAFTGIDDGEKTKTINVKLKDNKKNGYFGKLTAGGGTDHYYDTQLMLNMFKKKEKFSVYGIISNTGKTGLNWGERDSYGQSIASSLDFDEANGYYTSDSYDDLDNWSGQYNGQGYPSVKTGGVHFNNKWKGDTQSVNLNYKIMQLNVTGANTTNTQFILPDTLYYNSQQQHFTDQILRNRADATYDLQPDSSSSIKIKADAGIDHKITENHYVTEALSSDSALVNSSKRDISTSGDTKTMNSSILWRKKLHKKGRTFSVGLKENYTNTSSGGYLFSDNIFYKGGLASNPQITDQYKNYSNEKVFLDAKITYSEPLSAISSLIASYGVSVNNSSSFRNSFNKDGSGKYSEMDSLYSNDYKFNVFTQTGGLVYNLIKKKLRLNAGSSIGFTNFTQMDVRADTTSRRSFVNWFPHASLTYSFSSQKRLSIRYTGNTSQPSIQQIQPTRTNDDPLNIAIGNPGLKPQFGNNINLGFNDYKVLTDRYIYGSVGYTFTANAISGNEKIDSSGRRVSQSVNLNGNHSVNSYFNYGFKLKKINLNIGFNLGANANQYVNIVNDLQNTTNSKNYSFGISLYKAKEKKYQFGFNSSANYTSSTSSIQKNISTKYWTYTLHPEMDVFLPLKFQVHSDCDFNFRQKTSAFDNNTNAIIWNTWIGKKFFKKDALLIKASGNDLLNQNIGFNRTVTSNFVSQNTYTTIQRFFMLSVVWNFNKSGTPAPSNN